jgi:hypothetical protein
MVLKLTGIYKFSSFDDGNEGSSSSNSKLFLGASKPKLKQNPITQSFYKKKKRKRDGEK